MWRAMACCAVLGMCGGADGAFLTLSSAGAIGRLQTGVTMPTTSYGPFVGDVGYDPPSGTFRSGVVVYAAPVVPAGEGIVGLTLAGLVGSASPGAGVWLELFATSGPAGPADFATTIPILAVLVAPGAGSADSPFSLAISTRAVMDALQLGPELGVRASYLGNGSGVAALRGLSLVVTTAVVPEPSSLVLLGLGGVALAVWRRAA